MSTMIADQTDEPDILDDLPDDLLPDAPSSAEAAEATTEPSAAPVIPVASQIGADAAESTGQPQTAAQASAMRLAQIMNLHISGYSLAEIGAQIGASADEVDRMINTDATRYIRSQPALRTYVRNWISGKFTTMIEADWPYASNPNSPVRLENQDRVIRMLDSMGKLHGAHAPVQSEVKVDAAPETVEKMVNVLARLSGQDYDVDVFDVDFTEEVESLAGQADQEAQAALEAASEAVENDQPEDEDNPL